MDSATPGLGHNQPISIPQQIRATEDLPALVTEYLGEEFARFPKQVAELLEEARQLPRIIENDDDLSKSADVVKRLRGLSKEIEAQHGAEKNPYLRSGQAIDSFFFTQLDKVARRSKTAKPGAADILQERVDDYARRKLKAEQERRRQEEDRLRAEAEERRRVEAEAARRAEEDRLAAERARKPETQAAKEAIAGLSEAQASAAKIEADLAAEKAREAHIEALAKPADMMRTRTETGALVSMAREGYCLITDAALLNKEALWPHISEKELERALRAWSRLTGYSKQMAGAEIGFRDKTVIR